MWTADEITKICYRIITGITYFWDHGRLYSIHDPSPFDRHAANAYYEKYFDEFWIDLEILSSAEVESITSERGLWNNLDETRLKSLQEKINSLSARIPSLEFKSTEKAGVVAEIEVYKKAEKDLLRKKNYRPIESAEYMASLAVYKHLLFLLTFDENGQRLWKTLEEFKSADENLIGRMLSASFFNSEIDEKSIRKVARSEPWRSIWMAGVKTGNLFEKPNSRLTDYQRAVITWSVIYDNIHEHPECPGEDIIDNDTLLDAWMLRQKEERDSRKNKDSAASLISKNQKIAKSGEIGIIVDSVEDARKVYDLNDPLAKATIKNKMKTVGEKGQIREQDFADVQRDIQMQRNQLEMKKQRKK